MNINRRKFFRAVSVAALASPFVPSLLKPDKVQGEIYTPPKPEWYAWEEKGFAVLDNRKILLGNVEYTEEELAKALETPLRKGVLSDDVLSHIYEVKKIQNKKYPISAECTVNYDYQTFDLEGLWDIKGGHELECMIDNHGYTVMKVHENGFDLRKK